MNTAFAFLNNDRQDWARGNVLEDHDTVLFESQNFVVVPSIGALVEGWLLIVAKTPVLSMAALPRAAMPELLELKDSVARVLRDVYGAAVVFEHGPALPGTEVGCTVDQAHVHVVPISESLTELLHSTECAASVSWSVSDGFSEASELISSGKSYLYMEDQEGVARVACADGTPSQFFRRAIAARLGIADKFDWRQYPMRENVRATVERLASSHRFMNEPR